MVCDRNNVMAMVMVVMIIINSHAIKNNYLILIMIKQLDIRNCHQILFLFQEYKLALLQCYGRYLQQFNTDFDENNADVNQFKAVFFPKGYGDKTAAHTVR